MPWIPHPSDLRWVESLINSLNTGGYWGLPATRLVYRIDHKEKTLTCTEGDTSQEVHEQNRIAFKKFGYRVLP